jgi:thiamine kinase
MSLCPLEDIAREYVPGRGPLEIHPLAAGLVNASYRVARSGRAYLLRVAADESVDLGIDRAWECRLLKAAVAADLAPPIERCDPERGVLVAAWMQGRMWREEEIRQADTVRSMAQLLRRVHGLAIAEPARVMSPAAWIGHYQGALRRRGVVWPRGQDWSGEVAAQLALAAAMGPVDPVICHSDLHRLNILIADRPVLLDWEYAHVSDSFWDLAGWIANNDWDDGSANRLVATYLGRAPDSAERTRLGAMRWLYDYVCLLWSELYLKQRGGATNPAVSARAELLARRLAAAR